MAPSTSHICYAFYGFGDFRSSDTKVRAQKLQGRVPRCHQFPAVMRPEQGVSGEKSLKDSFWGWDQAQRRVSS